MGIKDFIKQRDAMLMTGDIDMMIDFLKQHDLPLPTSRAAAEVTLHKTRTAAVFLPMETRSESKRWLIKRGYQPLDDGDVPGDLS